MFSKNGTEFEISLLNEIETEEDNGTTIIIPINNDLKEWIQAIIDILPYFKGILVESEYIKEFNEASLYEGKHFYYRSDYSPKTFHIVLDQVIYQIELSDLDLPSGGNFPVGIKFGLDEGLIPVPSKDKILLTDDTKQTIRNRLKSVLEELKELLFIKSMNLYEYLTSDKNLYTFNIGTEQVNINRHFFDKLCSILKVEKIDTSFIPEDSEFEQSWLNNSIYNIYYDYKIIGEIIYSYSNRKFSNRRENITVNELKDVLVVDEILSLSKKEFLKETFRNITLVKFERHANLKKYRSSNFLNLTNYPKSSWRAKIIAWQKETDRILNSLPKLSDYRLEYEKWLEGKPKKQKQSNRLGIKEENDITIKLPVTFDVNNSQFNMKFVPELMSLNNTLEKYYIYSTEREEVNLLYDLWRNNKNIVPCILNKTELSRVAENKNFISYEEFSKGKTRFSHKWTTAYLITKDIQKSWILKSIFEQKYSGYTKFDKSAYSSLRSIKRYGEDIKDITNYIEKWGKSNFDGRFMNSVSESFFKLGLYDKPVYDQWVSLKDKLEKWAFTKYINPSFSNIELNKLIDHIYLLEKKNVFNTNKINQLTNKLQNCKDDK